MTHTVTVHKTARDFLAESREKLLERECVNNVVLGVADSVAGGRNYGPEAPLFATVFATDVLELAALMTPPHNLMVAPVGKEAERAADSLAAHLCRTGAAPPGVMGPVDAAHAFAAAWQRETGHGSTVKMSMRTHELRKVNPCVPAPGRLRRAVDSDVELLAGWVSEFNVAVKHAEENHNAEATARRVVESGRAYVWDNGRPVSAAARVRPSPRGEAVGMVYTPPECRGRGYATSCVAELCRLVLADSKEFVMLFTDLDNPVSNHVYRKVGFEPVEDFVDLAFETGGT